MAITKVSSGLISADASSIDLNIDAGTLYLDVSENRVGIGTTSPVEKLDVIVDATGGLKLGTNADAGVTLTSYQGSTNSNVRTIDFNAQNFVVNTGSPTGTAVSEAFRITNDGKVGIGTTSPATGLEVATTNYTFAGTNFDIYGLFGDTSGGIRLGADSSNEDSVIGTTGTNNLQFVTYNGSAWGSRMTLTNTGNVGIGTTPYANSLSSGIDSVNGLGLFGYNDGFYVSGNAYYNGAWKYKTSGSASKINSNSSGDVIISGAVSGSADGTITWADNVTIKNSGKVGIGTDSPQEMLTVNSGTTGSSFIQVTNTTLGTGDNAGLYVGIQSDEDGYIGMRSNQPLAFATSLTERMRIDTSGILLVGKTSATATGRGTECRIDQIIIGKTTSGNINGIYFNHNTSYVGGLNYSNTATSLATSSDERLKENIQYSENSLDKINTIKVRQFDWKEDGSHQDYGFVAQELEPIYAYAVHTANNEEETKSVDYSSLVPLLVKAIQEQQTIIDDLKTRIETLENV